MNVGYWVALAPRGGHCYKYFMERTGKSRIMENYGILLVFHTLEFVMCVAILSFYFDIAFLFLTGLLVHLALDMFFVFSVAGHPIAKHSLISWIYKNRIQKL